MNDKRSVRCDVCKVFLSTDPKRTKDVCENCERYIEANIKHVLKHGTWRFRSGRRVR